MLILDKFLLEYEEMGWGGVKLTPQKKLPSKNPALLGLKEINISFVAIPLRNTTQQSTFVPNRKLSGEAMASKVLRKINVKIKFLYASKQVPNSCV